MPVTAIIIYISLLIGAALSYLAKKLTINGAVIGAMVGFLIYQGVGLTGIMLLGIFFIAGSWATGLKRQQKADVNAAELNHGRRTAGQVLANGGVAAILGGLAWLLPHHSSLLQFMIAGSFAAATADTLSSELGMIYGRRFYNIINLKKDTRGLDGVVSLEGTLIGILGAALIAATYCIAHGWNTSFYWIILAGFTGNLADSILGATAERKGWLNNNVVNFLNTAIGAAFCWLVMAL